MTSGQLLEPAAKTFNTEARCLIAVSDRQAVVVAVVLESALPVPVESNPQVRQDQLQGPQQDQPLAQLQGPQQDQPLAQPQDLLQRLPDQQCCRPLCFES